MARDRTVTTSIDIRLQARVAKALEAQLAKAHKQNGAAVVMDPSSGDVLAMVSEPALPTTAPSYAGASQSTTDQLFDRARYALYPPGSTFKLVTAMAALRIDPNLEQKQFRCQRLPDGRAGTVIPGWRKPIRDDVGDSAHGTLSMERAITVSCNAYFAQLGVFSVGAKALSDTARLLDIPAGEIADLQATMPFASYGQGPVLVTPFKMARVVATIANSGAMPEGRWEIDSSNSRTDAAASHPRAPARRVPATRHALSSAGRNRAPRDERRSGECRGQDRHRAARRRHAALLVRRLRAL